MTHDTASHETALPEELEAAAREGQDQPQGQDRRPLVFWQARHDNGWRTVLLEQPDGAFVAYAGIDRTVVLKRVESIERAREIALAALRLETGHEQCSVACSEWAISVKRRGVNP